MLDVTYVNITRNRRTICFLNAPFLVEFGVLFSKNAIFKEQVLNENGRLIDLHGDLQGRVVWQLVEECPSMRREKKAYIYHNRGRQISSKLQKEMADLFIKQAKQYADARPNYPLQLFHFISSKTPAKDLAWDVGTGSGQAAQSLAGIYENVVGTDTSLKQLEFAPKLANVRYQQTPAVIPMEELEEYVSAQSSVDLVTIAQALHWFDLPAFYQQVKWVLKKPNGVVAAWCYTVPEVNDAVDSVFKPFYEIDSDPYWDPARKLVNDKYASIDFPFEPLEGTDHTGPFKFVTEREMSLNEYFTYLKSWSAYQTAKEKGVDLLRDDVVEKFKNAWNEDGHDKKVKFPVYLKIGKVGNM